MNHLSTLAAGALGLALCGCSDGETSRAAQDGQDASSWWAWHTEQQDIEMAVSEAINEPGGGDYANAADAIRNSSRPPAVKQFQIGQLIVGGIMERGKRLPPESMEQGLRMMEDSTVAPGQKDEGAVQQLRMLFERGDPNPPNSFPRDPEVASCWLDVEDDRSNDAARCIALRRQRLPDIAAAQGMGASADRGSPAGELVRGQGALPVRR